MLPPRSQCVSPMTIEKIKILGAVLELPAKQQKNFADLANFLGEMAGLAVLGLVAPKWPPGV